MVQREQGILGELRLLWADSNDDLALTSPRIPAGATVEVARRQHDGSWLWLIDQPNVPPSPTSQGDPQSVATKEDCASYVRNLRSGPRGSG